jgi:glutathione synthase/RimK-type ligase-like ATP-grasp enzyme
MIVAIHPDYVGPGDASSPRWEEMLRAQGFDVKIVDLYRPDVVNQLRDVEGLMWRFSHFRLMQQVARRVLRVAEETLGLTVYPDQNTAWHYDDKIAQALLFQALGIPSPSTSIWFRKADALAAIEHAQFPVVLKLSGGAGSENVRRLDGPDEARLWATRLFDEGVFSFGSVAEPAAWPLSRRVRGALKALILGKPLWAPPPPAGDLHRGYLILQEFLDGNEFDTRITVIGHRAFGYRRFNRPNDFRASGSGLLDRDPTQIDHRFVQLAFETARKLRSQSCAIDGLYRNGHPVVGEVSYTFINSYVASCPGRWELRDHSDCGSFQWIEGSMHPEDAQCEDFIERLHRRQRSDSSRSGSNSAHARSVD